MIFLFLVMNFENDNSLNLSLWLTWRRGARYLCSTWPRQWRRCSHPPHGHSPEPAWRRSWPPSLISYVLLVRNKTSRLDTWWLFSPQSSVAVWGSSWRSWRSARARGCWRLTGLCWPDTRTARHPGHWAQSGGGHWWTILMTPAKRNIIITL